jgi:hypothetical protein
MPRSLSTALQAQVSAQQTNICYLVEFALSSTVRATDFYTDLVYNSNSYSAGGSFLQINQTQETGELKVDEISITCSNVTNQIRSLVSNGNYVDKKVTVDLGFLDSNESLVGAINFFTGNIRSVAISETGDSTDINIIVANHWANWNLTKGRHYSDESQQAFSSGDKGFEFCTETKDDIRWGS